ncbi:CoA transferase [Mycobacterium sp. AMU20-3851]|uniref:CoA transferase n=1 Tax=Mycobacterium sp. AMU20-3851 TaxID=3122055 RepID=UPI0037547962
MSSSASAVGVPDAVSVRAQAVADGFTARTGVPVDAPTLLTGRSALLGLRPRGRISAGGATRLMRAADTWCAVTLSRPDDIAAVPALIEADAITDDPWPHLQRWVGTRPAAAVVERAGLLGIPAATLAEAAAGPPVSRALGPRAQRTDRLLVADMSSMWAGPLCGQLLCRAGATVIKVESSRRPDGTRAGSPAFYDWMNRGKLSYTVEFDDHQAMLRLLSAADVVIEGSRPAALTRRGLGPSDVPPRAGRVWVRITGHGAHGDAGTRVAFGDDAAVAGGLVEYHCDGPVFVGDAIADPLTGLHAAAAVSDALARGGGELIELSMASTAAGYAGFVGGAVREPTVPEQGPPASPLGADAHTVEALLDERHTVSC